MKKRWKGGGGCSCPAWINYESRPALTGAILLLLLLLALPLCTLATADSVVGKDHKSTTDAKLKPGQLALTSAAAAVLTPTSAIVGTKEGERCSTTLPSSYYSFFIYLFIFICLFFIDLISIGRQVYVVATADGRVYGVEGSTGEQLWSFHSGRSLFSGSSSQVCDRKHVLLLLPAPLKAHLPPPLLCFFIDWCAVQVAGGASGRSEDPLLIPGRDGSLYAYITSTGMLKVCVVRVSCVSCVCVPRVSCVSLMCVCVCVWLRAAEIAIVDQGHGEQLAVPGGRWHAVRGQQGLADLHPGARHRHPGLRPLDQGPLHPARAHRPRRR